MSNTLFGDLNILDQIKENHNNSIKLINDYNKKIKDGDYLVYENELDVSHYYNFIAAYIINLLGKDETLFVCNDIYDLFKMDKLEICNHVEWKVNNNVKSIISNKNIDDVNRLLNTCFSEKAIEFLREICAQDIVHSNKLIHNISGIWGWIRAHIIMESKGEEELMSYVCRDKDIIQLYTTKIEDRYDREYSKWGALIRNRIFKQKDNYTGISEKVIIGKQNEFILDYRYDKNACQSALLHINNEIDSSCGTGFVISEDGYAITCAHVVEGIKKGEELYATIIIGDGYPVRNDDFEVYDSGYGRVVYSNSELDIALLKMEHYAKGYLPIEQRDILPELGEEVVVFGYPLGYEMPQSNFFGPNISFYKGYVSSNQTWNGNSVTFLDIDVKSGNSGSPVISTKTGKVIGIISGAKVGSRIGLNEKMPYMIPIQHFIKLLK